MEEDKNVHVFPVPPREAKKVLSVLFVFLILASLFMLAKFIAEAKSLKYIGAGVTPANTIQVNGEGEAFAIPDIATISFTVSNDAKDVAGAQKLTTDKINDAIDAIKELNVDDKDIKTTSYNSNPKYDYGAPCYSGYCPVRNPTVIGYTVSQSISVKVRDTDKTGDVLAALGTLGVTDISGPNFTIDDEVAVKNEARTKAIADAKVKADELADELDVDLVRIVNFSESDNGYPGPVFYEKAMNLDAAGMGGAAPQIPTGENKYTSNVTITYEIR